jgi:hypothetical protein
MAKPGRDFLLPKVLHISTSGFSDINYFQL